MKELSPCCPISWLAEFLVVERAMRSAFDVQGRLETGVNGMLELRDPRTRRMLAKWIGAPVKTTGGARYSGEDGMGFDYRPLRSEDLECWRYANIPVIVVLVRLGGERIYRVSEEVVGLGQ